MENNIVHNQGYWFVLRDEQNGVLFNSNNIPIQNSQTSETRYIIDASDSKQYLQINDQIIETQEEIPQKPKILKDDDFWDKNKVRLLLTLCLENKYQSNSSTKDTIMWDEISSIVGNSPEECNKKFKNLRRTYIRLLKKKLQGKEIKWIYFSLCEEIFRDCKSPSMLEIWEEHKVRRLLTLYIENLHRFRNSEFLKKDIWKEIAADLGTTACSCYHKFKNLKRTYINLMERSKNNDRLIKWIYYQYFERIFYNFDPVSGPWNRHKIKQLLAAYAQIAYKFKNPKLQKKELWREIGAIVGEKPSDCDRKFRNLKQTYIKLKLKTDNGRNMSKWRYFKDFDLIYGYKTVQRIDYASDSQDLVTKLQEEDYIKQLLTFYIENKERFANPNVKNRSLWKIIARKIGMSWEACDKKFRNLKQTYTRLLERKKETGKMNKWPYFSYFEIIFSEECSSKNKEVDTLGMDNVSLVEFTKILNDVQERRNNNTKFEKLIEVVEESNNIQKERNRILQALLDRK